MQGCKEGPSWLANSSPFRTSRRQTELWVQTVRGIAVEILDSILDDANDPGLLIGFIMGTSRVEGVLLHGDAKTAEERRKSVETLNLILTLETEGWFKDWPNRPPGPPGIKD